MALSPKYPGYTDTEIIAWLVEMYSKGRSLGYIAKKSEIPKYKVRRLLLKAGIAMRTRERNDVTELRRCIDCGKELSLEEFYKDKTKHLGRSYRCKVCDRLRFMDSAVD
jgi:DNA-directed RNA polymerase subunit RPC12/RpoP